jgi:hypothetical protein
MERVVQGFEVAGVAILVVGSLLAFVSAALKLGGGGGGRAAYQGAQRGAGRAILLGLEVLIIADIVLTITVDRTLSMTDQDEPSARLPILGRGARCLPPAAGHTSQPQPLSQ